MRWLSELFAAFAAIPQTAFAGFDASPWGSLTPKAQRGWVWSPWDGRFRRRTHADDWL